MSAMTCHGLKDTQGPIAVPKEKLPKVLSIQTHVNGIKKQDATIQDLIFSVPVLVKTLSEGITLKPGDVLATGTVRIALHPLTRSC
jgi:2-keto-4-pentenoate hydratase/2-oxohepta-3-ene-1,7-dioic acid hydratase in catechol pathway